MEQKQLGERIAKCRAEKAMSQETVAEYMGVSRQAVTKWENNLSKPSSQNLIKLAQLFEVSVDDLLGNKQPATDISKIKYKNARAPWIFIGITLLCIIAYIIISALTSTFHAGAFICMFIIAIPSQLFLHIYLTYAIANDSFEMLAGYDSRVKYNIVELKKLLTRLDIHIGTSSTVFVFLLCIVNSFNAKNGWINGGLIILYAFDFILCIIINNYRTIDKLYTHEADKKRAIKGMPVTVIYVILLFAGSVLTIFLFEVRGIENNTLPAMRLAALLIAGESAATLGYFAESRRITKWNPDMQDYKIGKVGFVCALLCIVLLIAMVL